MNAVQKAAFFSRQINLNKNILLRGRNQKSLHSNNTLLKEKNTIEEKPEWLKKLKAKQARMQIDDGVPVFLKNGRSDKILFNLLAGAVIVSTVYSLSILVGMSKKAY